ncbi:MAG: hypothetical protein MI976_17275, partial [Pseudomonadales bacterium]|nr:hypothetical protein [Pseudomonadales bacterium]
MSNPIDWYMAIVLPKEVHPDQQVAVKERTLAFFTLFGWMTGIYSCLKWNAQGVDDIANGSWLLVLGMPAVLWALRNRAIPIEALANLGILLMGIFCAIIIYQLGAIHSPHIFWSLALIVFGYLLAGQKSGALWGVLSFIFVLTLIIADRSGYQFPVVELTPKQNAINQYSGYLLPLVLIWLAQAYAYGLREKFRKEIEDSLVEAKALSEKSENMSQKLGGVLEKATDSAETLLSSADKLSDTVADMSERSSHICTSVEQQAVANTEINQTLTSMAKSVEASTEVMAEIRDKMNKAENDVSQSAKS